MMDDRNPFAPITALPHTDTPAEPPASAPDPQALTSDASIASPAA